MADFRYIITTSTKKDYFHNRQNGVNENDCCCFFPDPIVE